MQKFHEGWQPTPPPYGYLSVGGDRERKRYQPDPYVAPIIKDLFELYSTGNYSIIEVTEWLNTPPPRCFGFAPWGIYNKKQFDGF